MTTRDYHHDLLRDNPPAQLGYDTLTGPSTFTQYCFPPNCPEETFPYDKYNLGYTNEQKATYDRGLSRLLAHKQVQRDDFWGSCPVFNSGMLPLPANFMKYDLDYVIPYPGY